MQALRLWGGVGFFMSGVFLYYYPMLDAQTYQIENAFGFGVGSLCFLAGGLLLFVDLSLRRVSAPMLLPPSAELSSALGSELSHGSVMGGSPSRRSEWSAHGLVRGGSPTYFGSRGVHGSLRGASPHASTAPHDFA